MATRWRQLGVVAVGRAVKMEAVRPQEEIGAWFFFAPDAVPERWSQRAVPTLLVPLLPDEAQNLLAGEAISSRLDPIDERLLSLIAAGRSINAVARELGISDRSVDRRLANLRQHYGVTSTMELAALLLRRGFS